MVRCYRASMKLMRVVVMVAGAGIMLAACGGSSSPSTTSTTTTTAMVSQVIRVDAQVQGELTKAFSTFKIANKEMASTDTFVPAPISDGMLHVNSVAAYDASNKTYYALANFQLTGSPSYAAQVSFQDGGSYGIFTKTASGTWVMTGSPGFPVCPNIVPTTVASLWKLPDIPACH